MADGKLNDTQRSLPVQDSIQLLVALGIAAVLTGAQVFTVSKYLLGWFDTYLSHLLFPRRSSYARAFNYRILLKAVCLHHEAECSTRVPFAHSYFKLC